MSFFLIFRKLLEFILRLVFVRDLSFLPEDEYAFSKDGVYDDGHPYRSSCTSLNEGTVRAQYGMRFMRLPFRDVASVLLNKELSMVTEEDLQILGRENKETELFNAEDTKAYIKNFYHYQQLFLDNYRVQKENGTNRRTIAAIAEEIAHNDLLDKSPSFVIINALSVYYRICSCYLAVKREEGKSIDGTDVLVVKGMLNSFFMRTAVFSNIYSIVEASYHYHDDLQSISQNYHPAVLNRCNQYLSIEKALLKKDVSQDEISTIMELLQKTMISFPIISRVMVIYP